MSETVEAGRSEEVLEWFVGLAGVFRRHERNATARLEQRGESLAGAPFYRYDKIGDETIPFALMVGIPTEGALDGDQRVHTGTVPEGTYAASIHEGHPDRLPESHAALQEWAAEEGHELARSAEGDTEVWEGRYEFYLTDPVEEPDQSEWSTEIAYLVE